MKKVILALAILSSASTFATECKLNQVLFYGDSVVQIFFDDYDHKMITHRVNISDENFSLLMSGLKQKGYTIEAPSLGRKPVVLSISSNFDGQVQQQRLGSLDSELKMDLQDAYSRWTTPFQRVIEISGDSGLSFYKEKHLFSGLIARKSTLAAISWALKNLPDCP